MLAYLLDEPGGAVVEEAMLDADAFLSTVNEAEVLTRLARLDESLVPRIAQGWRPAGAYRVEAFTELDAARAAQLYPRTRPFGSSLGDRACLALGHRLDLPVLTADRAWVDSIETQLVSRSTWSLSGGPPALQARASSAVTGSAGRGGRWR